MFKVLSNNYYKISKNPLNIKTSGTLNNIVRLNSRRFLLHTCRKITLGKIISVIDCTISHDTTEKNAFTCNQLTLRKDPYLFYFYFILFSNFHLVKMSLKKKRH